MSDEAKSRLELHETRDLEVRKMMEQAKAIVQEAIAEKYMAYCEHATVEEKCAHLSEETKQLHIACQRTEQHDAIIEVGSDYCSIASESEAIFLNK